MVSVLSVVFVGEIGFCDGFFLWEMEKFVYVDSVLDVEIDLIV